MLEGSERIIYSMSIIGVINYDMGNIQSVVNALEYICVPVKIIRNPEELVSVDKIILPGVGAFGEGIKKLKERNFTEALNSEIISNKKPFLGICLGMQLICKESFEFGHFRGLGWIDASVRRLPGSSDLRVPHVGWNSLIYKKQNYLIKLDSKEEPDVYFVHSYYVDGVNSDFTTTSCIYGLEFTAALQQDNIFATQFHPEKSQKVGLDILRRFSEFN